MPVLVMLVVFILGIIGIGNAHGEPYTARRGLRMVAWDVVWAGLCAAVAAWWSSS